MQVGDLVKRRNNGDLAIVIPEEHIDRYGEANVLTLRGHKQYWFPVDCEVISASR